MTRRTLASKSKEQSSGKRPINLLSGWPNASLYPTADLLQASHFVLSDPSLSTPALRYGPDEGSPTLRSSLASWLNEFYQQTSNPITADHLCITGGASQNLACILQAFTDPIYTRNIWMIAPTYFLACRIFDDNGFSGKLRGVPEDDQGLDIAYLKQAIQDSEKYAHATGNTEPKLKSKYSWRRTYKHVIYGVPTFANPSGRVMSLSRREQLVQLAREYDALIVTDDVYDMLQWRTEPTLPSTSTPPNTAYQPLRHTLLPRIVDIDRALPHTEAATHTFGNALSNGTFSKLLAPGLRVGFCTASTPALSYSLSQTGSSRSGGAPSQYASCLVDHLLTTGKLDAHVFGTVQETYSRRYHVLMRAVRDHLVPLGVEVITKPYLFRPRGEQESVAVSGGYFVYLTLPRPLSGRTPFDAQSITSECLERENLTVIPGAKFRVEGDEDNSDTKFNRDIRLCFAWEDEALLEEGVMRLAKVLKLNL